MLSLVLRSIRKIYAILTAKIVVIVKELLKQVIPKIITIVR